MHLPQEKWKKKETKTETETEIQKIHKANRMKKQNRKIGYSGHWKLYNNQIHRSHKSLEKFEKKKTESKTKS